MLWIKAFHIVFVICWFAGIFYLPRLFVYHAMAVDEAGIERLETMERKLYRGIMTPSAIAAVALGAWLMAISWDALARAAWLHAKLAFVVLLIAYHVQCGRTIRAFAENRNRRTHTFYRWFNEVPLVLLVGIVILAVVRPF